MISNSNSDDFTEVPRTKHIKKRLIKSRVLTKILHSLSIGDIRSSELPITDEHFAFIQTLTGIQASEFSCMLITDFSVDITVDHNIETANFSVCGLIGESIAKHFINEWTLTCSNDYRIIYDEYSRGLAPEILIEFISATPLELSRYASELASSKAVKFEYDIEAFERTVIKAKHLFRQDKLIINAISLGASLPQLQTLFENHRLCDSRSVAVIKQLYPYKGGGNFIADEIKQSIIEEYQIVEAPYLDGNQSKEEFLSKLYNLLTSVISRFDVSFSESWNAIRTSEKYKTIRSHK
jgi:hypothetical protein